MQWFVQQLTNEFLMSVHRCTFYTLKNNFTLVHETKHTAGIRYVLADIIIMIMNYQILAFPLVRLGTKKLCVCVCVCVCVIISYLELT